MRSFFRKIIIGIVITFLAIGMILSLFSESLSQKWFSGGINTGIEYFKNRIEWVSEKLANKAERASSGLRNISSNMKEKSDEENVSQ